MAADTAQAVIYAVETDQHGLYEVRLHRLAHLDNKNILEIVTKEGKISAFEEASRLFEQFSSLELYYAQVCELSDTICPNYYRWKIHPL